MYVCYVNDNILLYLSVVNTSCVNYSCVEDSAKPLSNFTYYDRSRSISKIKLSNISFR